MQLLRGQPVIKMRVSRKTHYSEFITFLKTAFNNTTGLDIKVFYTVQNNGCKGKN
jgi:hypothetical protein